MLTADLPLARPEDVAAILAAARPAPSAVLVPSHDGTGTNAMLLRPPRAIAPRLGPGSLARHLALAARRGVAVQRLERPRLALDIDTPRDLAALIAPRRRLRHAGGLRPPGGGRAARRRERALRLWPLSALPEVRPGDDLAAMLAERAAGEGVAPGDVLVVAHKVVSKAEGRIVALAGVRPGPAAAALAAETGKEAALCELILSESRRVVRRRGATVICETHHGFVCANAGVDSSNAPAGAVVLLPVDPDASARRLQARIAAAVGGRVGLVVTDTHGRAFRRGLVNVAIGVAGFEPVVDHRGGRDREGRVLVATDQAIADELAAAAGLHMGKAAGTPAVVASGVDTLPGPGGAGALVRDPAHDLFRT